MVHSSAVSVVFGLALFTAVAVNTGYSITCYVCNSAYDGNGCLDPFKPGTGAFAVQDCAIEDKNKSSTFTGCMKTTQNVNGASRTIRGCSTVVGTPGGCISRIGTASVNMNYCQCVGAACNGAVRGRSETATVITSALVLLMVQRLSACVGGYRL